MKKLLGCLPLVLPALLLAQPEGRVVVMTSYPQELISRYETAFENTHPGIDMVVEWRRSDDALALLATEQGREVDVYWAPSLDTFVTLADAGYFATLDLPLSGLPGRIGDLAIDDAQQRFAAFEVAGFGFAYSQDYLDRHDLPLPRDWSELADPRYRDALLMPVPSRQGFSPMIYQSILQGLGWDSGWRLITAIAGNSELLDSGGGAFIDELAAGRKGIALSIDFFPKSAQANGQSVDFRYASTTLFSPAYVSQLQVAPRPAAARRFIDFVLSDAGQALLLHRDVARLPVRPSAYDANAAFNPFAASVRVPAYDFDSAGAQQLLLSALFDVQISENHAQLRTLAAALDSKAKEFADDSATLARINQLQALLYAPLLEIREANSLQQQLKADPAMSLAALMGSWRETLAARRQDVQAGLSRL